MSRLPITMACGPYDRMEALALGEVRPEGIDLRYLAIQSPPEIFARMIKTASFDVAEMSLAHYMIMKTRTQFPFIAIPVFPSRVFRHSYIFVSKSSGIKSPGDLAHKRIGVQEYRQTAGVWVRGILQDEYQVDLSTVQWFEGGVNEPRGEDAEMDLRPTADINLRTIPSERTLNDMLEAGEIDAYFGARQPAALLKGKNVARLLPNYREAERDYYRKTGFHPIMHTLVLREDLHARHPWVAEALFKACQRSKSWALQKMRFSGAQSSMLPWLYDEIAEMETLMGSSPWPYGLEANRKILSAFSRYLVEQSFIEAAEPLDKYFAPIVEWSE
ncbi:MAG: 4,5-dihydroxyphthalate decarboxylase [Hyphomicrobiales bacterium]|nr:4,5-dihydroxyphthalate decarboxylase [Hyphomicrobiales bacterium]